MQWLFLHIILGQHKRFKEKLAANLRIFSFFLPQIRGF